MDQVFDVAIIGGGINGCGCAADAALRGLSVVLFEKDDLASKTSSSSTKLIHGGLRYLENYQFGLVKKALEERHTLLQLAPHIVHQQSFILPYESHMRPAWLIRLGLFFYDHLSRKNHLPKCRSIHRSHKNAYFKPLIDSLKRGYLFYDAATDDARLTIINALQAKNHGADIRPHSLVTQTKPVTNQWQLNIQPKLGSAYTVRAKTLINASGPWVEATEDKTLTLVKGSHMVVPQIYPGKHAYLLQHSDKRVVFVIPYHGYSMIGTTEVPFTGDLNKVRISEKEITYLTGVVNSYFKASIKPEDIIYSWSGVRPLLAHKDSEYRTLSRDYSFQFEQEPAPKITIFGGKITTYRQLAEDIIDQLKIVFPNLNPSISKHSHLPGALNFSQYVRYAKHHYSWLGNELLHRYLSTYGTCMETFMAPCTGFADMGKQFTKNLYQVEVDYLRTEEWAQTVADILERRTKLILDTDLKEQQELENYLTE